MESQNRRCGRAGQRTSFGLFTFGLIYLVKYAINEFTGIDRPELLRYIYSLVYRHLGRNILHEQELICRESEDISIDNRHALKLPICGVSRDHLIYLFLFV